MHFLLKIFIYYIGFTLLGIAWWTNKFFGVVTIDQVFSTIAFSVHGVLTSDPVFISRFLKWCVIGPIVATILLSILNLYAHRICGLKTIFKIRLDICILLIGLFLIGHQFSFLSFIKNEFQSSRTHGDYFATNYVNPDKINFTLTHPKSLILIYVESLENTYGNKKIFGRDLLFDLNQEKKQGVSFNHYQQMPGTGWTIAAFVSTQCGLPLKDLTILGKNRQGEIMDHFLRNATCLSDILAKHHYKNIYMNGSSIYFGGFGKFLRDHHYTEIYGREEWHALGIPDNQMTGWGLHDDDLFKKAESKLTQLMQKNKPFNLTILTIDTHGYEGTLNSTCKKNGFKNFPGIVECTSKEITNFIQFVNKKGWNDKVTIVILGDHLVMKNPLSDILAKNNSRTIFNLILTTTPWQKSREDITHFDMFPTILDSLGFHYPKGQLGLGYTAFKRLGANHPPKNRKKLMKSHLEEYSKTYAQLM